MRFSVFFLLAAAAPLSGQTAHQQMMKLVEQHNAEYVETSKKIWSYAELGYHEDKSSALLQQQLKAAGFSIQANVAGEPPAFIASYGQGKPIIGVMGEFDALPGLSQAAVPDRSPVKNGAPGHGCGHNLLGSGAALAAVAVKEYMAQNRVAGTLRYYGTPAEEGGSGKVYMIRAGLFKDVDVMLQWHPSNANSVSNGGALAMVSARFTFRGMAAHAALAPDRGRSALDAIMLMGNGIEFLREHVPSNTRMHYIITDGGAAANVVPDTATMELVARSPTSPGLDAVWKRILKIADGASLMTETTLEVNIRSAYANIIGNDPLAKVAQKNLEEVGGFRYTPEEMKFAEELQKTLPEEARGHLDQASKVEPLRPVDPNAPSASTDAGDVSWKRADNRLRGCNVRSRRGRAYVAGYGVRGHEHRAARNAGGGQGARDYDGRSIFRSETRFGGAGGFRAADEGEELCEPDSGGCESSAGLLGALTGSSYCFTAVKTPPLRGLIMRPTSFVGLWMKACALTVPEVPLLAKPV
jgi:aminobenzoyl-glutamate utilization protein B